MRSSRAAVCFNQLTHSLVTERNPTVTAGINTNRGTGIGGLRIEQNLLFENKSRFSISRTTMKHDLWADHLCVLRRQNRIAADQIAQDHTILMQYRVMPEFLVIVKVSYNKTSVSLPKSRLC